MTNSETSSSFSIFALDFGANWNSFRFSHAHTFQVITTIGILFDLMLHTIFLNTDSVNRCGPSRGGKRLHSARISFLRRWFIAQTYTWLPDPVPPCTRAADLQPINTNRFMTVTNVLLNIYSGSVLAYGRNSVNGGNKQAFHWNRTTNKRPFYRYSHVTSTVAFSLIFAVLFLKMQTLSVNTITSCHGTHL